MGKQLIQLFELILCGTVSLIEFISYSGYQPQMGYKKDLMWDNWQGATSGNVRKAMEMPGFPGFGKDLHLQ